ncbi:Uncharacterised protein [Legionella lansingensis]|uniref:Lipoprotein n=1 Tax=Legionella lansingensis TaxID=45067 RepID=A0A0W0VMG6_9GAMM|nr:hypothetical protein Llan_1728 [Legionella lansingensis]SNV44878.1 Uncharacterised protein [Legionella lansingensis]
MKKLILAVILFAPTVFLTSCSVTTASYSPRYGNDFVYSVGYYGYRPYWGTPYFTSYGWRSGYWGGYRGVYFGGAPQAWYGYVSRW